MTQAVILEAKRTPVGRFGCGLANVKATELGSKVMGALVDNKSELRNRVDEIILGNVLSAGLGQNPARIAAAKAGFPWKIPAYTVNKVCGSGLKSIIIGTQAIEAGEANLIIAGGMENMSQAPYLLDNYRSGVKFGPQIIRDSLLADGLFCSLIGEHMGMTAENIARRFKISRRQQDQYALKSHQKAVRAIKSGKLATEIVPIGEVKIDEGPRQETSLAKLSKLKPVFKENGTVTAGNASSLNDGGAAVLISSATLAEKNKYPILGQIISYASVGLDPKYMGLGSYYAALKSLQKAKLKVSDIDLWEINEAFASQSIAVIRMLGIEDKKVNVNGGAIAYGHPIGSTGARILVSLLYEMKRKKSKYGLASLCIGGGQGVAMLVENR